MIEKYIAHCKELVRSGGACHGMTCTHCPGEKEPYYCCWDPAKDCLEPSEIVITKAKEFLIEHQEIL